MPFSSKAQRGFLFANHPKVAQQFAAETSPSQMQQLPKFAGPGIQPPKVSAPGGYAEPKWATNPWQELIKRKGVKNLRNKGF